VVEMEKEALKLVQALDSQRDRDPILESERLRASA